MIPARPRKPCRPRHPCAVPRTSLQCVYTRRRNCIEQLSPSPEYAPGIGPFPARNRATIELTHYPRWVQPKSRSVKVACFASVDWLGIISRYRPGCACSRHNHRRTVDADEPRRGTRSMRPRLSPSHRRRIRHTVHCGSQGRSRRRRSPGQGRERSRKLPPSRSFSCVFLRHLPSSHRSTLRRLLPPLMIRERLNGFCPERRAHGRPVPTG